MPESDHIDRALAPAVTVIGAWLAQRASELDLDPAVLATRADLDAAAARRAEPARDGLARRPRRARRSSGCSRARRRSCSATAGAGSSCAISSLRSRCPASRSACSCTRRPRRPPICRAAWQAADALEVDSIWVWDHFFPLYGDPDAAHFECYTLLAAMAVETTPRAHRRARHVQLVPQPQSARRHVPHDRPPERRPLRARHRLGLVRARLRRVRLRVRHRAVSPARPRRRAAAHHGAPRPADAAAPRPGPDPRRRIRARRSRCGSPPSTPTRGTRSARPRPTPQKNRTLDEWCAKLDRNPRQIERTVGIQATEIDDWQAYLDAGRRAPHRDGGPAVRPRAGRRLLEIARG